MSEGVPLRLLLIEDDAPVMRLMAWALKGDGFDVQIVSPREALELRGLEGPDAAIFNMSASASDKKMYNRHLRTLFPNCVIIDVDQYETAGLSVRDSDADAYRLRPLSLDDLVFSIRAICAQTIDERSAARFRRGGDPQRVSDEPHQNRG